MVQVWNTGVLELQTYVERVNQAADDLTDDPTFDFNSDERMSDLLSERSRPHWDHSMMHGSILQTSVFRLLMM